MGDVLLSIIKIIIAVLLLPLILSCALGLQSFLHSNAPNFAADCFYWGVGIFIFASDSNFTPKLILSERFIKAAMPAIMPPAFSITFRVSPVDLPVVKTSSQRSTFAPFLISKPLRSVIAPYLSRSVKTEGTPN